MKVVIDSFGLLVAIGRNPKAFAGIDALVAKQAAALLTAQLKHKSLDFAMLRSVASAIGNEPFELFLDTVDDKLLKAIAKKVDPHAALTKAGDGDDLRLHLGELAAGRIDPSMKPIKSAGGSKKAAVAAGSSRSGSADEPHAIATKPPGRR